MAHYNDKAGGYIPVAMLVNSRDLRLRQVQLETKWWKIMLASNTAVKVGR